MYRKSARSFPYMMMMMITFSDVPEEVVADFFGRFFALNPTFFFFVFVFGDVLGIMFPGRPTNNCMPGQFHRSTYPHSKQSEKYIGANLRRNISGISNVIGDSGNVRYTYAK